MGSPTDRRPLAADKLLPGEIDRLASVVLGRIAQMNPDKSWGLGVAKVIVVDYEELFVTLRMQKGSSDEFVRLPVPITFPGAGNRHFFGAMPEVGDHCIVGWMPQESSQPDGTRTPVILAWMVPGTWPARDWAVTAGFSPDEFDLGMEKNQALVKGVHDRIRRKLRHMQPGNVVASSSQGSDVVLDEGVTIANRRGNEFRLRDQDQAAVTRALQRFDALAGVRAYHGMVQRDAQLLQTQMVSDGKVWDGGVQSVGEAPLKDSQLPEDPVLKRGFLAPTARVLRKKPEDDGTLVRAVLPLEPHLDPYQFLQRGGFINSSGFVVDQRHKPTAVYGGKPIFRVAAQSTVNAVLEPDRQTLTEYRIEVNHTSDGRLPVTEQTDMFDADRLPPTAPGGEQSVGTPPNRPFIEWVLGSVVGNDPFSSIGRPQYGVPLVFTVFDGDQPNPRVGPAKIVANQESGASPTPIEEHAATLFRIRPPLSAGQISETFWSFNKKAQLKAALGGPVKENSAEIALAGGLKLSVGGAVGLLFNGGIKLGSQRGGQTDNVGVDLDGGSGAVRIMGGGPISEGERSARRQDGQETSTPSVLVKSEGSTRLEATKKTEIRSETVETTGSTVSMTGQQVVALQSPQAVRVSGDDVTISSGGKRSETFSGPKGLNPANGPLLERSFSTTIPGITVDQTTYESGSRKEVFKLGSHETTVKVGNLTYQTFSGTLVARSGGSKLELSGSGFSGSATTGDVTLEAVAGTSTFKGFSGVQVESESGSAIIKGSLGVQLQAPLVGPDQGGILCSGSLEPLTGLPYSTWGVGAVAHRVESN